MSWQFVLDALTRPLFSLSYQSSDEDMEIDSVSIADNLENQDCDEDIQDLACYRESDPFLPQLIAGRAMTTELSQYLNDFSLPNEDSVVSASTFTEPSQDLREWRVGGPPGNSYDWYRNNHPITYPD